MTPRGPLLLAAAALAGACATPPDRLEEAARAPAPGVREAFRDAAPAVLPDPSAALVEGTLRRAGEKGSLSLEDCVRIALATQEDLVSADEDRLQAWLRRDLALSGILPDVRMLLDHDRQDPTTITGSGGSVSSTEPARTQWSVRVVQPLFQGLREFHAIRSAERTAGALAAERRNLQRALGTAVARAFFLVVEADAEMRAQAEALRLDDERVLEMTARAGQGLARRTEVLLQESRRETTRAALVQVRERRDAARVLLERLVGTPLRLPLEGQGGEPLEAPDRAGALAEALRLRPDLRAAELRLEAAREDRKIASGERWPLVEAEGNWYIDRWNYSEFAERTAWDLALVVELPLFLGGAIDARERIADSRIRQAALARSSVLRAVVQEVDAALARLAAGMERLEALRSTERFARENLALLQEEYRQGLATNLEVFTAQILLQDATVALERQQYQSRLDRLEVFLAAGRDDVVGVPRDADPGPASAAPEGGPR